jgi:Cu-processing system permease protein
MTAMYAIYRKEIRDAVRSRWLLAFAITFAVVATLIAYVQGQGGSIGGQGLNRTTASLINLGLMLVPLLALLLGGASISGERERGTLNTLLSQPITATEILLGKYFGLTAALWMAVGLGFGAAGILLAFLGITAGFGAYVGFVLLSAVLASAMLGVGMLVSVLSDSRLKAIAIAVLAWFVLVIAYDLGAIGMALALTPSGKTIFIAVLANPVECVRILAVMGIERDLDVLGPLGAYLSDTLGRSGAIAFLATAITAWTVIPVALAAWLFGQQDA